MKKLIAALLVSCMAVAPMTAMAEEAAGPLELTWDAVTSEESVQELLAQGEFVTFDDIACQMWVPYVMEEVELTDNDVEAGYIGYFSTEEGDGVASVTYVDAQGMTLEDYKAELENDEEATTVTDVIINGIPGVGYDLDGADTTCVAFSTDAGYILEFAFAPASDEGFSGIIGIMMSSIMPEESVEEATEAA